jgi:hypothetical protein
VDIGTWLHGLGLQQYEKAFRDNAIDAATLPALTAEDLKDLDLSVVGHRRCRRPFRAHPSETDALGPSKTGRE